MPRVPSSNQCHLRWSYFIVRVLFLAIQRRSVGAVNQLGPVTVVYLAFLAAARVLLLGLGLERLD